MNFGAAGHFSQSAPGRRGFLRWSPIKSASADHLVTLVESQHFDHTSSANALIKYSNGVDSNMDVNQFKLQWRNGGESDGPVLSNCRLSTKQSVGIFLALYDQRQGQFKVLSIVR